MIWASVKRLFRICLLLQKVEQTLHQNEGSFGRQVTAYERRIERMEREQVIVEEKLRNQPAKAQTFEQLFEHAMTFLANPWKIWESGNLALRRTVLRLAFADPIASSGSEGLRTPKTT